MADLNFNANLLPTSDSTLTLGSSSKKWNIYGTLVGDSDIYVDKSGDTMTGNLSTPGLNIECDWENDYYIRFREGGGDSNYGALIAYGANDTLKFGTRQANSDVIAMTISRGSTNVNIVGAVNAAGGTLTGPLTINYTSGNGSLKITSNGNTLSVGSMNTSYCHFQNSSDVPFYFNKTLYVDGDVRPYGSSYPTNALGSGTYEWGSGYIRQVYARHLDASKNYTNDQDLYIGYNWCSTIRFYTCDGTTRTQVGYANSNGIYGAVWNDYAEFRQADITAPGYCIIENGNDTLSLSTERLQKGANIISDTFGFAIGETDECKTPIAVSGRVLAYPYEDREEFKKNIGSAVCSGPNGTVSIMTDEECIKYPNAVIGTISAVPDYEIWGTGKVKVNGRIWIRIR